MRVATATRARYAVRTLVGTALACAIFGATASSALAVTNTYSVNVTPTPVPAGGSTAFDVAIANDATSGAAIQSAAITVPAGFKVTSATVPPGTGLVDVVSDVILLGHLSVAPGSTLDATVTATVAPRCSSSFKWASQANAGDLWTKRFTLSAGNSNLTTTTTACTLQFGTQPADTVVNQPIRGTVDDPSGPPLTVQILNSAGTVIDTSAAVKMVIGNNPGGATLSGGVTKAAAHGIATFSTLKLNKPGLAYTLTASSTGAGTVTSSSFDESQTTTTTCTTTPCKTSLSTPQSSLLVSVNQSAGTVTESVDLGSPLVCDDAHGNYFGFDPNWYGLSITGSSDKQLTYTLPGVSIDHSFTLCFGATADFTISPTGAQAAPGTLPDGTPGFIGPLATCSSVPAGNPCVESVVANPNGNGVILTADIPLAFAGDPWSHM